MADERPPATTAPLEPIRVTCPKCVEEGRSDPTFETVPRSGRRRKYCDAHARSPSAQTAEQAYRIRLERNRSTQQERRLASEGATVSRLAAGLRVYGDAEQAARLFGVDATGPELEHLVGLAKRYHGGVVAGDMRDTARLAQAVVHAYLTDLLEQRHEIPARDKPNALRTAHQIASELIGDGAESNFVQIVVSAVPPPRDGRLTKAQLAKVRGNAKG
jgi:hypothetical protein